MNARIINLRTRRKQKAREDRRAKADENAVRFGRTMAEKTLSKAQNIKDAERLDGHRLDTPDDDQAQ